MKPKTIACISLSNHDFSSFQAKLDAAAKWVTLAAKQGADLVILPETINLYRGDGPDHSQNLSFEEAALDDWQQATASLVTAAQQAKIAVTIPVLVREADGLRNSCFFMSSTGRVVGRYDKTNPTPDELESGIVPGKPQTVVWEGLRVGCAICFDTDFPDVFEHQDAMGAQLFVIPSLQPGGRRLNDYAYRLGVPIAIAYPAWSRVINYDGLELAAGGYRWETLRLGFGSPIQLATVNFDYAILHAEGNQQKMIDVQREYGGRVAIRYDQDNTLFYAESRANDLNIDDVLKTFDLIPVRTFYDQYKATRARYADI